MVQYDCTHGTVQDVVQRTLFLHLQKISVLSKYLRNEMRSEKMKSFRLNRILRRVSEQSFEEIGEPFVVGRRSDGNTVSHL